jgi:hypothetical protein
MNLRRRLAGFFVTVGAGTSLLATTGSAHAATDNTAVYTCQIGELCMYKDVFAGTVSVQQSLINGGSIRDFRNSHFTDGEGLNDQVSSIINNTNNCYTFYPDINFGASNFTFYFDAGTSRGEFHQGLELIVQPHSYYSLGGRDPFNVDNRADVLNDKLSSAKTGCASSQTGEILV